MAWSFRKGFMRSCRAAPSGPRRPSGNARRSRRMVEATGDPGYRASRIHFPARTRMRLSTSASRDCRPRASWRALQLGRTESLGALDLVHQPPCRPPSFCSGVSALAASTFALSFSTIFLTISSVCSRDLSWGLRMASAGRPDGWLRARLARRRRSLAQLRIADRIGQRIVMAAFVGRLVRSRGGRRLRRRRFRGGRRRRRRRNQSLRRIRPGAFGRC